MKLKIRALLCMTIVVLLLPATAFTQQEQETSKNSPYLQQFLERHPEADLDSDGILTRKEIYNWRNIKYLNTAITHSNIAYGEHPRQVLDFWQATSDTPTPLFVFIHGGGFRHGDKNRFPLDLLNLCLKSGISCASINYRLTHHAPYPVQMLDGARAIQFLRFRAEEWNIDPNRFAAGGNSAGSGISQWIGYHDDMADPKSDDPVARYSTRLCCVVPINMQSTYDPREIKKLIPGTAYKNSALLPFFARSAYWDWDTSKIDDELDALLRDASPINHLTADDPPVFLIHYEKNNKPGNIHHSNFGKHLKEAMDKLGIECVQHMDSDYESKQAEVADMVKFLKKQFGMLNEK